MRFKIILLGLILTFFTVIPAQAATKTTIQDIENYLNNISALQADFTQNDQEGLERKGVFYLNRPGKLRFEYYPMPGHPLNDFIVADGKFVYYYDSEMEEQTNAPIGQTLADLILRPNLSLEKTLDVVKFTEANNQILLVLRQKKEPEAGQIDFTFTSAPLTLKGWTVTDATGYKTTLNLRNITVPETLDSALFVYKDPKNKLKKKGFELNE
jgi:outer membrane lipoprotein-sorting protein